MTTRSDKSYARSTYGHGAPVITGDKARRIAAQLYNAPKFSCRAMSRPGCFMARRAGFRKHVIVDANMLSPEEKALLKPHKMIDNETASFLVDASHDRIEHFETTFVWSRPRRRNNYIGNPRWFTVPIWVFKGDAWCILALFADIRPKDRSLEDALAVYEAAYTPTAHERMEIRARLQASPASRAA